MIEKIMVIIAFMIILIVSIFFAHRQSKKIAQKMKEQNEKFEKESQKEWAKKLQREDKVKRAKRMQKLLRKKRMQTYRRNRNDKKRKNK